MQNLSFGVCCGIVIVFGGLGFVLFSLSNIWRELTTAISENTFDKMGFNTWRAEVFNAVCSVVRPRPSQDRYAFGNPLYLMYDSFRPKFKAENFCKQCAEDRAVKNGIIMSYTSTANNSNRDGLNRHFHNHITCQGQNCAIKNQAVSSVNDLHVHERSATYVGVTVLTVTKVPETTDVQNWAIFCLSAFVCGMGMKLICVCSAN